jgi:predicted metal-dependent hydrolase
MLLNIFKKRPSRPIRANKTAPSGAHPPTRVKTQTTIEVAGRDIPCTLIHSRLARNISLKISPESGLEITVPFRFNPDRLQNLIHDKHDWITNHITRLDQQKTLAPRLREGATLQVLGQPKILRFILSQSLRTHIEDTGPELMVHMRSLASPTAKQTAKTTLELFLRRRIKHYIQTRTPTLAAAMQTRYGTLTIRAQKSRWGSCTRDNHLNFNWRLIFFPTEVIDYVIFHELTHTIHHNHSARFYALLQKNCPDYKNLRKQLRDRHFPL